MADAPAAPQGERDTVMVLYVCRNCQMSSSASIGPNPRIGLPRWNKSSCCAASDQRAYLGRRCTTREFAEFTAAIMFQDADTVKRLLAELPKVEENEIPWADAGLISP